MVDGAALEKRWAMSLVGSNPTLSATDYGEVLEWSIRRAWRARVAIGDRGFESHPLRHYAFGVFATQAEDISVNEILPAQGTKNRFSFRHRCCQRLGTHWRVEGLKGSRNAH